MQIQYALQNRSKQSLGHILLVLDKFLPGLVVRAGDGSELVYLPSWRLAAMFGSRQRLIDELAARLNMNPAGIRHVLWIELPIAVARGKTTTVCLDYEDDLAPAETWRFIRRPWYAVEEDKRPETFDTYVEIDGPPSSRMEFRSNPRGTIEQIRPADQKKDFKSAWALRLPKFLQVRLPASSLPFAFRYRILPLRAELIMLWVTYVVATSLPLALLTAAGLGEIELRGPETNVGEIVSGIGLAGTAGIAGFARPAWANRLWFALPLLLYVVLLAVSLK